MNKVFLTNVVVSKGYGKNPALNFFNNDEIVRFRIGQKVYDTRADDNTRWLNFTVKAFKKVCEKIKNMKIKEGSYINIEGKLDEDSWETEDGEKKSATIIILDDIEYASSGSGNGKNNDDKSNKGGSTSDKKKKPEDSENFTGFESLGGNDFFDQD